MKNRNTIIYTTLVLMGIFHSIYYFLIREEVRLFLAGTENILLEGILNVLYPRFEVESLRFSPGFFLEKADQVVLRFSLCAVLISFLYSRRYSKLLPDTVTTKKNVAILRVLFFLGLIILGREMYPDMLSLENLKEFYKPVLLLKIIPLALPGKITAVLMTSGFFAFCLLAILDVKAVISASCAIGIFIIYQGYLYSFEKTEHAYATVNYVGFLIPFLLYEARKARTTGFASSFLSLIMLVVAGSYLLSGMEKLLIAGPDWVYPQTFVSYLYVHYTDAGHWVASQPILTAILPVATMTFQLLFITSIWKKKLRVPFVAGGILFHWGTVVLLGISSFINPWILPYIFFLRWDRLRPVKFLSRIIAKKPAENRVPVGKQ